MRGTTAVIVVVLGACSCDRDELRVRADPAPHRAPTATPVPAQCATLDRKTCLETPGCILDQPFAGAYECRAAQNACERAARHADIAGTGADIKSVNAATREAAATACRATPGCVVTSGRCSCLCAVLGSCDCSCGGGYLARCAPSELLPVLDGRPRLRPVSSF